MGDAPFQQITDSELVELIERRSPHHKRCISRGELRAFMDGRLVPRDAAAAAAGEGRVMDISSLVEAMRIREWTSRAMSSMLSVPWTIVRMVRTGFRW